MNFKKLLIVVAAIVLVVSAYKFFTRVDRTDAVAVANAFTKAMKNGNTEAASAYLVPADAVAWREQTNEHLQGLRSGRKADFFERIPATPGFTAPVTANGKTTITAADNQYALEMTQVDGKWYVARE